MHGAPFGMSRGKSINLFDTPRVESSCNSKLEFMYINTQGAKIYKDPMNRYVVKIADIPSKLEGTPLVNYQGDQYMGIDGARYEVTEHPTLVDDLGIYPTSGHGESTGPDPSEPNQEGTYKTPSMSKESFDALFADLHWEHSTGVTKKKVPEH